MHPRRSSPSSPRGRRSLPLLLLAGASLCAAPPLGAATLSAMPPCERLEAWARQLDPASRQQLAPKVAVPNLLGDALAVPLFGRSVLGWDSADLSALRRALGQCRKLANRRKDRASGDQLYQALKAVDGVRPALTQVQRTRQGLAQNVDWLFRQRPGARLAGQLSVARDALQGQPVALEQYGLSQRPNWLSVFEQAPDYLPAAERAPFAARLETRIGEIHAVEQSRADQLAAAQARLARLPDNDASLPQLDELARLPVLREIDPAEADAFSRAVNAKRYQIQRSQQQAQAREAQARAAEPVDIDGRLGQLLRGDSVAAVAVGRLRPGIGYDEAKRVVAADWGLKSGVGGDLMKEFSTTLRDLNRYVDSERRDGGRVEFETMHGRVGQLKFYENYTGPVDGAAAYRWLTGRFGEPAARKADPLGFVASWHGGDTYLDIFVGNRVSGPRSPQTFHSSVVVALWSQAYADYVDAAARRCQALRRKPMGELSVEDKQALLMGCKSP